MNSGVIRWLKGDCCAIAFLLSTICFLSAGFAQAETVVFHAPHTGFTEVVDLDNPGKYAMRPGSPDAVIIGSDPNRGIGNISWTGLFSGSDFSGWFHPTHGSTRRNTAFEVLNHLSDTLNEFTGTEIDITFQTSGFIGGGTLAQAGTFYSENNGYSTGFAQQHITSGTDPSGLVADIVLKVDFTSWTWNNGLGDPAGGEFDLYSVLLHEITHALGIASTTESDGTSSIFGGNPAGTAGKYHNFNRLTQLDDGGTVGIGSSTAQWTGSGGTAAFTGNVSALTSNALVFVGTNAVAAFGSNPRVYAPGSFADGSSLGHWHSSTGQSVMRASIASGVKRRTYLPFEIGALVDLGYSNAASTQDPLDPDNVYVDFTAGSNGNGASTSPFDNLADAVSAANANANIFLEPGSSAETFTGGGVINKDLTLQNNNPGGGSVTVGSGARSAGQGSSGFVTRSEKK